MVWRGGHCHDNSYDHHQRYHHHDAYEYHQYDNNDQDGHCHDNRHDHHQRYHHYDAYDYHQYDYNDQDGHCYDNRHDHYQRYHHHDAYEYHQYDYNNDQDGFLPVRLLRVQRKCWYSDCTAHWACWRLVDGRRYHGICVDLAICLCWCLCPKCDICQRLARIWVSDRCAWRVFKDVQFAIHRWLVEAEYLECAAR